MRYCQEKGIVCQYAGTNMHCRLTACVFPKESLYPTASRGGYLMDIEKLIEDLRGLLKQYGEKIPYGELVGAPWPYSMAGDLVWQDPEPYFIEQAAIVLSTLQAENEKMRAELERVKAERDAAVEDVAAIIGNVEEIRQGYGVGNADAEDAFAELCGTYCANKGRSCYAECEKYHCKNFKWRGPQKENKDE